MATPPPTAPHRRVDQQPGSIVRAEPSVPFFTEPRLVRVWRMRSPGLSEEAIGAILKGPHPNVPRLPAGLYLAVTEFVLCHRHRWRDDPHRGRVLQSEGVPDSTVWRGVVRADLAQATAWLDDQQRRLTGEGWIPVDLEDEDEAG